jgi:ATP-dependent DNA helicase RecG
MAQVRDPEAIARKLGLADASALILHLPLRYEDETRLTPLRDIQYGRPMLVEAYVIRIEVRDRKSVV